MASTFMGLNTATRGLYSAATGLLVTSNNVSNVSTEGYSRQVVNQSATTPAAVYSSSGIVGGGSQVNSVDRVRNFRLDQKYWSENSSLGEWESKSGLLTEIEEIMGEPQSNGFTTVMDEFYSALEDLSSDPSGAAARASVQETGNAICQYLNDAANRLSDLQESVNRDVGTAVSQINSYAEQIAKLNEQIRVAGVIGGSTNELEDQRDLLVDKLSGLTSISVTQTVVGQNPSGADIYSYTISSGGSTLVNAGSAQKLETYENSAGLYGVRWQDSGSEYTPSGGALKGYLDVRDGTGEDGQYKGVAYYSAQLDNFARIFAEAFNEGVYAGGAVSDYSGHAGGVTTEGETGIRFFSYDKTSSTNIAADIAANGLDAAYAKITAANISLSSEIAEDVKNIAAASAANQSENNENILDLISITKDSGMFNKGTPEDSMNAIIATLGTSSSYAQNRTENQEKSVKNADDRRTSVSGVSSDEEAANLTKYEQAYSASAQLVTVWNSIYQTTINMVSD
ncbi:flagellar hook-associated protein FlgK|uniref:Flagellar hook-associated protein 1 n=1 Tax=Dendrosporobacter quercicolus TaxID=146817 RepID=A0A1G9VUF0_9FIRM|nr:flagellar hook-associated protein FlgK [Dendrosporobacter quercicolus]NSL47801.1 flagellar hook-associated protein FlgK [Dendrosporobacter quercicolus DSM 1736]SDM75606.1 flagellar hook-associated protein 1 FlgK [Dendrosporobacter quercicolus]